MTRCSITAPIGKTYRFDIDEISPSLAYAAWNGACKGTPANRACDLSVKAGPQVLGADEGAKPTPPPQMVTISASFAYNGAIMDPNGKLDCGTHTTSNPYSNKCSEQVAKGSTITLKAYGVGANGRVTSWGGACAGKGKSVGNPAESDCTLTVNGDISVSATFSGN